MHKRYDHKQIEEKWQKDWGEKGLYDVGERDKSKEKEYVLVEWPYPSGNLHIGHWYAFGVPDIYVRYKRMEGKQVLYPFGYDAFGLPAENAAIKRNLDPKEWTESNIEYMSQQIARMGNAFSWDTTCNSTDPEYYKWTQWMFTKFFEAGIAYRGEGVVNWCPGCNTVIANEQVLADGTCERSGDVIEKKSMPQWMLKITDFADELLEGLEDLDWPHAIKESQRNWIGKSEGAEIDFALSTGEQVTVFTTRADTLYGATYLVLAPEHELVTQNKDIIKNWNEVEDYIALTKKKAEQDRLDGSKEKTGVKLEGITATNPASGEEIPVYVADYVLASYGTGAIMAVPAHDQRDFEFARKLNLPIKSVLAERKITHAGVLIRCTNGEYIFQLRDNKAPTLPSKIAFFGGRLEEGETIYEGLRRELLEELELDVDLENIKESYTFKSETSDKQQVWIGLLENVDIQNLKCHEGSVIKLTIDQAIDREDIAPTTRQFLIDNFKKVRIKTASNILIDSNEFDGLSSEEAKAKIVEKVGGRMTSTYRLRDWSIGRQRYWGTPIPIVYDPEGKAHVVPVEHLPWTLPEDVDFRPTGEPPLAKSEELKKRTEEIFGKGWTPEVETMDTFVDSSWYFLRYIDSQNNNAFSSLEAQNDWMQIDTYFGGAEHTTMHLLYSRFWQKALHRLGLAEHAEPYVRRINRSLILGPDGNKMSKSKDNVIDPDEQVERVGADTVKMYLAFMGPYAEVNHYPFDLGGIAGIRRFLERVNGLSEHITEEEPRDSLQLLHKTIKKVRSDVEEFKFNTAISALMVYLNHVEKTGLSLKSYDTFLRLLAPFAPHLTAELWHESGNHDSIHKAAYPNFDATLAVEETVTIGVQINGKVRGDITISPDADEKATLEAVQSNPQLQTRLEGKTIKKVIYVRGRILNLILEE